MKNIKYYDGVILNTMAGIFYAICAILCFLSNNLVAGIINTITSTVWFVSGLVFQVRLANAEMETERLLMEIDGLLRENEEQNE